MMIPYGTANTPTNASRPMTTFTRPSSTPTWDGDCIPTPNVRWQLRNADGSTTLYFASTPPAGAESNWIPTDPNGRFEALFRFYGPKPRSQRLKPLVQRVQLGQLGISPADDAASPLRPISRALGGTVLWSSS